MHTELTCTIFLSVLKIDFKLNNYKVIHKYIYLFIVYVTDIV